MHKKLVKLNENARFQRAKMVMVMDEEAAGATCALLEQKNKVTRHEAEDFKLGLCDNDDSRCY